VALVSLVITAVAVVTPLVFHRMIRDTWLSFLYVRPPAIRLVDSDRYKRLPVDQLAASVLPK
jgi:hypothetical protein